jgi:hypothetical protein
MVWQPVERSSSSMVPSRSLNFTVRAFGATPPRYRVTNEQMADQVRSRSYQGVFDEWVSKVRK